jgi:hypothetical protein
MLDRLLGVGGGLGHTAEPEPGQPPTEVGGAPGLVLGLPGQHLLEVADGQRVSVAGQVRLAAQQPQPDRGTPPIGVAHLQGVRRVGDGAGRVVRLEPGPGPGPGPGLVDERRGLAAGTQVRIKGSGGLGVALERE